MTRHAAEPNVTHPAKAHKADPLTDFQWAPQPAASAWVKDATLPFLNALPWAAEFAHRLYQDTGNRLVDLIDTLFLKPGDPRIEAATAVGWEAEEESAGRTLYNNPQGIFPTIAVGPQAFDLGVELKVERVADFLAANLLSCPIAGHPLGPYRHAIAADDGKHRLSVAERHGSRGFETTGGPPASEMLAVAEVLRTRPRQFDDAARGFASVRTVLEQAIERVGRDAACDLFFAAEREYWCRRNRAAQAQKARQDRLGIGWANHDHHTYRSSRASFKDLVGIWELLGLFCRERFYAGMAAGWGAQVMEQPVTRIITFNDVDLSPEELMGDFSHDGLAPRDKLGTIGLWCGLHGEAVLQAGMHHLECVFDFDALKDQLQDQCGIRTMKPFTNFPYLRQAFTEGEVWAVDAGRIARLLDQGLITEPQAVKFRAEGAIGSHLENLERNDGFKGFNQDGVSEIIAATDPRRQAQQNAFENVKYDTVGKR